MAPTTTGQISLSATTLVGDPVLDISGERVGRLEDLMIDIENGVIAYAVVSFGGIMGIGAEFYPVPWRALMIDTETRSARLEMDQEYIKDAPPMDKREWPVAIDYAWLGGIYDYYKIPYYW